MTFLRGPGAGHVGGWAAGPAELWHICVFIVRRGGGGGEGGRRLNSIYSSVVFREEREIEFTGDAAGRRAGEPGGLQGEVGEVGPGWARPPSGPPCLAAGIHRAGQRRPLPLRCLLWPSQWVLPGLGPLGVMAVGACVQSTCTSNHT